jgi:hypothetical protein
MNNTNLPSMTKKAHRSMCLPATEDDDIVNRLINLNLSHRKQSSFLAGDKMDIEHGETRRRIIIKTM